MKRFRPWNFAILSFFTSSRLPHHSADHNCLLPWITLEPQGKCSADSTGEVSLPQMCHRYTEHLCMQQVPRRAEACRPQTEPVKSASTNIILRQLDSHAAFNSDTSTHASYSLQPLTWL